MITVLIPTAGVGSRLGTITDNFNKALIPIGKKPSISYIIDYYPKDTKFIIALGFRGNDVREFLELAYPDLDITFVEIENYNGEGSGLGLTLKSCEPFINSSFFFHANDTIITDKFDWSCFHKNTLFLNDIYIDPKSYVTASINRKDASVEKLYPKTLESIDNPLSYIGIAYIEDYLDFKKKLKELDLGLTESDYFINYCNHNELQFINTKSWYDIGDIEKYRIAISELSNFDNLLKEDETIYFIDDKVIKFFKDKTIITDRIKRAKVLKGLVPKLVDTRKNFYSYDYVPGVLMSELPEIETEMEKFLIWSKNNLWKEKKLDKVELKKFEKVCHNFYYEKTLSRINKFFDKFEIKDKEYVINGHKQKKFEHIIRNIEWEIITKTIPTGFHGDLHFENILKTGSGYSLLDWRQNFGGLIDYGDMYYDLAKLNHGLIISHSIIKEKLFNITIQGKQIYFDFNRKNNLMKAQVKFNQFLEKNNLSKYKVDILTNLIFLNIAALHTYPYSIFLYFLGIFGLNEAILSNKEYE
tara:strand:- start:16340 stop:17923 length:1584 start_codon:yes stop_codon:yes gene_type:complete